MTNLKRKRVKMVQPALEIKPSIHVVQVEKKICGPECRLWDGARKLPISHSGSVVDCQRGGGCVVTGAVCPLERTHFSRQPRLRRVK